MSKLGTLLAALAALGLAAPAIAAPVGPSSNPPSRALIVSPLAIVAIDDLDFGSAVSGPISGTLIINSTTGARTATGGVTPLASDPGQRAVFTIVGTANRNVLVTVIPPPLLTDGFGNNILVVALLAEGLPIKQIGPGGTLNFGVGGVINIDANQPDGVYSAQYDVLIDYF